MKTFWLLDSVALGDTLEPFAKAVSNAGLEYKVATRPKPPYTWDDIGNSFLDSFSPDECVVVSGDIDMVMRVRESQNWIPGVFADVEQYFCTAYYPVFGDLLLNSRYVMLPFGELSRRKQFLLDSVGRDGMLFVRPDSPLKSFTGQVVSDKTYLKDLEYLAFHEPNQSDLVVVCCPQKIRAEWRFVVVDGNVTTGSLYKSGAALISEPVNDGPSLSFAQETCFQANFAPERVWILDICQTEDGKFHVLEVGGFSFAGLYACDLDVIVKSVSEVAAEINQKRTG